MPKKNELPECPVCWTNKAVDIPVPFDSFTLECIKLRGGCGERTGPYKDIDEAISVWTEAAEKRRTLEALAAKVPRLSKKLPDSRGAWWHSRDLQTKASMGTVRACGVHGRLEWENDPLEEVGGYWAKCLPPEMPEEPTFGRNLAKALEDGEAARVAATEERINRGKS
jgi:hypothetical protein